jgi:transposase
LDQLAVDAPAWLQARAPQAWYERYAARFDQAHLPKTEAKRKLLAVQIGQDGRQLLEWAYAADSPEAVQKHAAIETLRQIWVQQYYMQGEAIFWRKKDQVPPSGGGIASPYDPQARFSIKRQTEWLGYKGHFTEICEAGWPHWITHVETTPATQPDSLAVAPIHQALETQALLPGQHFMDMGYVDTEILADSQNQYGVEVIGPIQMDNTWQASSPEGLDVTRFDIHWAAHQVICPAGKVSQNWYEGLDVTAQPRISVAFNPKDCGVCHLRAHCTRSAQGPRRLSFKPRAEYELLQWARRRQQTPEFQASYTRRAGIEGTLSQGVRAHDLRRSRYIGLAKTHLQHILTAIALNLIRFVNWVEAIPLATTRKTAFVKLASAAL